MILGKRRVERETALLRLRLNLSSEYHIVIETEDGGDGAIGEARGGEGEGKTRLLLNN